MHRLTAFDRRVVVVDLGWVRGRSANAPPLSNRCRYLVPDALFREVATSDDVERAASKTWAFVRDNAGKLLVGKYWDDVVAHERTPSHVADLCEVVEWELTAQLCRRMIPKRDSWLRNVRDAARDQKLDRYAEQRQRWLTLSDRFVRWLQAERPEDWRQLGNPNSRLEAVRHIPTLVNWAVRERTELDTQEWRDALAVFPDRHAFARALRLLLWTVHHRAAGVAKKFENYWDDVQYAFLASYAGTLVTGDRWLARMTADCFPSVLVLRDLPDDHWIFNA